MAQEIERKFLLADDRWRSSVAESARIKDGLVANTNGRKTRVRIIGERATITLKGQRHGLARSEFEYAIPVSDAEEILHTMCDGRIVEKIRHYVPHAGVTWEIDVYHGSLTGIVIADKSGVSGAGKAPTAKTHFMYAADNLSAYGVFSHRHTGELLEQIGIDASSIVFTPHLLPIPRGILSTIYVRFKQPQTHAAIAQLYWSFFADSPMVRIYDSTLPQIQYSVHTNYADIGFQLSPDGTRAVIVSCLDNLLKGASSQAVQNLNVMLGWNEPEGLE